MNEFLTEEGPLAVYTKLEEYQAEVNTDLKLSKDEEKKHILIEDPKRGLTLKLKFFKVVPEDEDDL
jgi:hypothetical protein